MTQPTNIKALIVDDELLARKRLRKLLRGDAEVEIIGECASGREAVVAIQSLHPDLVFLDVQMPEMDGFAALESLASDELPLIIFVTAYDQYALRAFEVCALDYLLKPVDRERFAQTLQRAKARLRGERRGETARLRSLLEELKTEAHRPERIAIKAGGRIRLLKLEEIDWIEAEGKYARLHFGQESHLLREAMSSLEARLDPRKFVRIHRSTIVNVDRIKELESWFNYDYRAVLNDGTQLIVSRSHRQKLANLLINSL